MTHKQEIAKVVATYLAAFPQSKLTDAGLLVYVEALQQLDIATIKAALSKLMRTSKFFPSVAEIYEQAEAMTRHVKQDEQSTAAEAWGEVMGFAKSKGIYQSWDYSRPEIKEAVKIFGGREELCMLEMDNVGVARAQFMKIYDALMARKKDRKASDDALKIMGAKNVAALVNKTADILALDKSKGVTRNGKV